MTTATLGSRPLTAFAASAVVTARLLGGHQLRLPRTHVGERYAFGDGSRAEVYRETLRTGADTRDPTVLVVRFRLRHVGRSRLLQAAFRVESIANTPLFAGFPGFRSKLWLTDLDSGVYRGLYQWDGADRARRYAETLCRLLRVLCEDGTVDFHVQPGWRDEVLARPPANAEGWWSVRREVTR